MKLQKLVYIAHCWLLYFERSNLIEDRIEAWHYGPVVPVLYQEFKSFGAAPISKFYRVLDHSGNRERVPFVDDETMEYLRLIWKNYGKYTSIELSAMTHSSSVGGKTPWQLAMEQGKNARAKSQSNALITSNQILQHYKHLAESSDADF
jgi:uncharacterized phage-associated protein